MIFIVDNYYMSLIGLEIVLIYIFLFLMGFICSLIFMYISYYDNNLFFVNFVNI